MGLIFYISNCFRLIVENQPFSFLLIDRKLPTDTTNLVCQFEDKSK